VWHLSKSRKFTCNLVREFNNQILADKVLAPLALQMNVDLHHASEDCTFSLEERASVSQSELLSSEVFSNEAIIRVLSSSKASFLSLSLSLSLSLFSLTQRVMHFVGSALYQ